MPFFAEIRKIIENKALLTKKNFYNYEENASYRSCSIRCYELRQQVLRQKVLPGHLLPVEVVEAEAAVEVAE